MASEAEERRMAEEAAQALEAATQAATRRATRTEIAEEAEVKALREIIVPIAPNGRLVTH
jgi:hypothetical protein